MYQLEIRWESAPFDPMCREIKVLDVIKYENGMATIHASVRTPLRALSSTCTKDGHDAHAEDSHEFRFRHG